MLARVLIALLLCVLPVHVAAQSPLPVVPHSGALPLATPDAGGADAAPSVAEASLSRGDGASAFVTYHEDPAFPVYEAASHRDVRARARQITQALTTAIDAEEPAEANAPLARVTVSDGVALVRVRGFLVAALYPDDARAAAFPSLEAYAEHIEARLLEFVPAQMMRGRLQQTALHIFLSVFLGLLGFAALRQLKAAFDRANAALEQRRDGLTPLTVFHVPLLSAEAMGGALAVIISFGRILSYMLAAGATLAAIMGQFDRTRALLARWLTFGGRALLDGVQDAVGAIPSLALALLMIVGLHAGLRVLHLVLDGVGTKRIVWRGVTPPRVPVLRAVLPLLITLTVLPLVVAAAFGRFNTPLEHLSLFAVGAVLLGTVPTFAAWCVGAVMLWRRAVQPGDWVEVMGVSGEVVSISLWEMTLVPERGGTLNVPMLHLLLHPVRRYGAVPPVTVEVCLKRDRPVRELVEALRATIAKTDEGATAELVELGPTWVRMHLSSPSQKPGTREALWFAVSDAAEGSQLTLWDSGRPA